MKPMKLRTLLDGVQAWHVPPRCQGQIVEVSYGVWADGHGGSLVARRAEDRSDGSVTYAVAPAADDDQGDYWNAEPTPAGEWNEVS